MDLAACTGRQGSPPLLCGSTDAPASVPHRLDQPAPASELGCRTHGLNVSPSLGPRRGGDNLDQGSLSGGTFTMPARGGGIGTLYYLIRQRHFREPFLSELPQLPPSSHNARHRPHRHRQRNRRRLSRRRSRRRRQGCNLQLPDAAPDTAADGVSNAVPDTVSDAVSNIVADTLVLERRSPTMPWFS